MSTALGIVLVYAAGAVLLSWLAFRRYEVERPSVGVFDLGDVTVLIAAVIVVPYLYLAVPDWFVAALLALATLGLLYVLLSALLESGPARWALALAAVGADVALALALGATSPAARTMNNIVLVAAVVAVVCLWAQSGIKARDCAILAAAVGVYDLVATGVTPLTSDLFDRLADLPLAPQVAGGEGGEYIAIGAGDLIFAALAPPVFRKAFGRDAGIAALAIALAALAVLFALAGSGLLPESFPTMLVLAPLVAGQYAFWRARSGRERTTWEYLSAEPLPPARAAAVGEGRRAGAQPS